MIFGAVADGVGGVDVVCRKLAQSLTGQTLNNKAKELMLNPNKNLDDLMTKIIDETVKKEKQNKRQRGRLVQGLRSR